MTQIAADAEAPGAPPGQVEATLAQGKLGTSRISFQMTGALGPLLVAGGTFTTAFAATGLMAVPAACIVIAVVLAVFAVGYLAMGRHVVNTGAFYGLIGTGLGRPAGVAAALLAMVGYCAMQVSLYGIIGVEASVFLADNTHGTMHITPPWWGCALAVWALVGILGLVPIKVSATLLGILSAVEIIVMLVISAIGLAHAHAGLHLGPFNPARITWRGFGPLSAITVLCYLGFEQALVFMEESKDRRRTPLRATVVVLAVAAVIYIAAAYAMDSFYGQGVAQAAQSQGPEMFFSMGQGLPSEAGHLLFNTSLLAAALAYHNVVTRYVFSIARARVLPSRLARVRTSGIPRTASLLVSAIGLAAILATLAFHWDPMNQLFYYFSTFGGYTIMALLAVTSCAIIAFFARDPHGENAIARRWLPAISALALTAMVIACTANLPTLLNVSANDPTINRLLALLAVVVVIGVLWSLYLRQRHPDWYAHLAGPKLRAPRSEQARVGAR